MLQINAIGYIGNDSILKEVNGKKVSNFSIAHSEKYKDSKGNLCEKTTWLECSFWDAENVNPFLKRGTMVYIAGTPESNGWINKEGEAASNLRCRVVKLELLGGKKENAEPEKTGTVTKKEDVLKDAGLSDDMPF